MNADVLCSYPLRDLLLAHLKRGRGGHEGDPSRHLLGTVSEPSRWEGVAGEPPFIRVASFVRDRLRQIRQELTMQQPSFSIEARQVAVVTS